MRPPICAICDEDLGPDGGLLSFRLDDTARDWHARANAEPGFVGHPPEQEWFCETHLEPASELTHLTRGQAISRMRKTHS